MALNYQTDGEDGSLTSKQTTLLSFFFFNFKLAEDTGEITEESLCHSSPHVFSISASRIMFFSIWNLSLQNTVTQLSTLTRASFVYMTLKIQTG